MKENKFIQTGLLHVISLIVLVLSYHYVGITLPIFNGVDINFFYILLAIVAGLAGSLFAAIVGVATIFIDLLLGTTEQWIAIAISVGMLGYVFGLGIRRKSFLAGTFSRHDALRFNVIQVVSNVIIFGLILPTLEVFFYQASTAVVFINGWIFSMINSILIAIFATALFKLIANRVKDKAYK